MPMLHDFACSYKSMHERPLAFWTTGASVRRREGRDMGAAPRGVGERALRLRRLLPGRLAGGPLPDVAACVTAVRAGRRRARAATRADQPLGRGSRHGGAAGAGARLGAGAPADRDRAASATGLAARAGAMAPRSPG